MKMTTNNFQKAVAKEIELVLKPKTGFPVFN